MSDAISKQHTAKQKKLDQRQITLSLRDSATFAVALARPKPINSRLRDTVCRYRKMTAAIYKSS